MKTSFWAKLIGISLFVAGAGVSAIWAGKYSFPYHTGLIPSKNDNNGPQAVIYKEVQKGFYSKSSVKENLVVNDTKALTTVWVKVAGSSAAEVLPKVDFTKETIIALFEGERPTGGYSVGISRVVQKDGYLEVGVIRTTPSTGCFVTQALTSPYFLASIPKYTGEVKFIDETKAVACN